MGKRRRYARLLFIAFLASGLGFACVSAATPDSAAIAPATQPPDLLRPLQGLLNQLRTLRQDYYRQKAADEVELRQARENRDLLRTQVEDLRKQETELDRQLAEAREQVQSLEAQREQWRDIQDAVDRQVAPFVVRQRSALTAVPPYHRQERLARLHSGTIDGNEPGVGDTLDPIWSYAQEELRLAASSETYTERAPAGDDAKPYARYFRVGQTILGYVTEDGRQAAIWLPLAESGQWQTLDAPKQIASLRSAIEILDRQQAPRLVPLPIGSFASVPTSTESQ